MARLQRGKRMIGNLDLRERCGTQKKEEYEQSVHNDELYSE